MPIAHCIIVRYTEERQEIQVVLRGTRAVQMLHCVSDWLHPAATFVPGIKEKEPKMDETRRTNLLAAGTGWQDELQYHRACLLCSLLVADRSSTSQ
jgi:hypothetical protein